MVWFKSRRVFCKKNAMCACCNPLLDPNNAKQFTFTFVMWSSLSSRKDFREVEFSGNASAPFPSAEWVSTSCFKWCTKNKICRTVSHVRELRHYSCFEPTFHVRICAVGYTNREERNTSRPSSFSRQVEAKNCRSRFTRDVYPCEQFSITSFTMKRVTRRSVCSRVVPTTSRSRWDTRPNIRKHCQNRKTRGLVLHSDWYDDGVLVRVVALTVPGFLLLWRNVTLWLLTGENEGNQVSRTGVLRGYWRVIRAHKSHQGTQEPSGRPRAIRAPKIHKGTQEPDKGTQDGKLNRHLHSWLHKWRQWHSIFVQTDFAWRLCTGKQSEPHASDRLLQYLVGIGYLVVKISNVSNAFDWRQTRPFRLRQTNCVCNVCDSASKRSSWFQTIRYLVGKKSTCWKESNLLERMQRVGKKATRATLLTTAKVAISTLYYIFIGAALRCGNLQREFFLNDA